MKGTMTKQPKSKTLCAGCRENFYNGNNDYDIKECWNYKSARMVNRLRIGWWTPMDNKDNFEPVQVLSCRRDTGTYAYFDSLPRHLKC